MVINKRQSSNTVGFFSQYTFGTAILTLSNNNQYYHNKLRSDIAMNDEVNADLNKMKQYKSTMLYKILIKGKRASHLGLFFFDS